MSLRTLDLSNNKLTRIEGLRSLPALHTLNVAKNSIATTEDIAELRELTSLVTLDISDNALEDAAATLAVLLDVPAMTCLYLRGNPLVRKTQSYRKTVLSTIARLGHLDDSPVFDLERRAVEAWKHGGREAEAQLRKVRACTRTCVARCNLAAGCRVSRPWLVARVLMAWCAALPQVAREEEAAKSKQSLRTFFTWQQQIRDQRAMELEDLKAQARRQGLDDSTVTLPRRSFVSYRTGDPEQVAADESKKRVLGRAEAHALRTSSKGMTMMDVDGAAAAGAGAGGAAGDRPRGDSAGSGDECKSGDGVPPCEDVYGGDGELEEKAVPFAVAVEATVARADAAIALGEAPARAPVVTCVDELD